MSNCVSGIFAILFALASWPEFSARVLLDSKDQIASTEPNSIHLKDYDVAFLMF